MVPAAAIVLAVVACNDSDVKGPTGPKPDAPSFAATDPFNSTGSCFSADVFKAGFLKQLKDSLGNQSLETGGCTANDIRIAEADIFSYSVNGGAPITFTPGDTVSCNAGDLLSLNMRAHVEETATSERTDIGIWIANDGGNARIGECKHFNLVNDSTGVSDIDGDSCGDMSNAETALVQMGTIDAICAVQSDTSRFVHIGSCLGWTQPGTGGDDRTCPTTASRTGIVQQLPGDDFRFGTTPGTTSKCNCEGFNIPFIVNLKATLEIKKVCSPTTDGGTFDLLIDGSATGVSCGGTTGPQTVDAGTNANPGAPHTFGEAGTGTTSLTDYTTVFACKNRGNNTDHAPASGTSTGPVDITLLPNEDVICTYTNTRLPQVKLVKDVQPDNDAGRFDLTIGATTFDNGGAGYGDQGTTGFQNVAIGTVAISEAGHDGTTLSEYGSTLSCVKQGNASVTVSNNTGTSGSITVAAGDQVTCTFVNNHAPRLQITKVPDPGTAGYNVSAGQIATFTITVSNLAGGGPALDVVLTDTLPAGVGDWTENPDQTDCTISPFPTGTDPKRLLVCSGGVIGTLDPGESFTVVVQATVPESFVLKPPAPAGDPLEIEGNLIDDGTPGKDWANIGIDCLSDPTKGCALDKPTGQTDDSFGQGTKEDTPVPKVVDGSIPNNKSDLTRFYVANERFGTTDFLYLAWERVQEPTGTTNMDFELNQLSTPSGNGVTPVRKAGDILIKYDLSQGGVNPVLGFHKWITTGSAANCEASNKLPCWDKVHPINNDVAAAINTGSVDDPIDPNATRTLSPRTFGEARIDLEAAGIFQPGVCVNFGQAYLKSRSSDSFTSAIKDFIAPIAIQVANCEPKNLDNTAWVKASNFAPTGGNLGDPINNSGQIHVSDAGPVLTSPTNLRLAQLDSAASMAFVAERRRA